MAKLISNQSFGPCAAIGPRHYSHHQFQSTMFSYDEETGSEASSENEDSFLGAKIRFPPSLCRNKSISGPLTSRLSTSTGRNQPLSSSTRSIDNRRHVHNRDPNDLLRSRSSQNIPKSKEEIQIQQLYIEAQRHQAATARVTSLKDFQTMTFTLPAARQCQALKSKNQDLDGCSPLKHCPLMPTMLGTKQRGRVSGPMFRGKKSRTTSAAAGSFVAEAKQADQYYCKDSQRNFYKTRNEKTFNIPSINEMEDEDENKQRWKSLLPKKWSTSRTMAVEI